MTVWNTGNGDAKGVTLSDPLPQNPGTSWSVDAAGAGFARVPIVRSRLWLVCRL